MAMRDILDRQASAIEYVLHTHGIQAHVDGGKLSPRLAHFHLALPHGLRASQISPLVPEIADAVGVVSCRLARVQDDVYLEVPRPDPVPVRLLPVVQRVADVVPPATATLGLDADGTPLLLRLNSPEVDPVIIAGNRGSGKSSLLRSMALSLALHNSPDTLRLLLLDCTREGTAFRGLEPLPHLSCPVAYGPVDGLVSLRWALRAMSRRIHTRPSDDFGEPEDNELTFGDEDDDQGIEFDEPLFEYNAPQPLEGPSLVVMIDGADDLCASGNRRADAECAAALRKLLAGSGQGIHLVLSAERPEELEGLVHSWGARITGVVSSSETARIATGAKGSGAQDLLGAGDFLVTLNAELIRFQAATLSHSELDRAVDLIVGTTANMTRPEREERTPPAIRRTERQHGGRPEPAGERPLPIRRSWVGE